jgi:uncharacterized protein YbcI
MVHFHKHQFGRGPTTASTNFCGPDALMCVLENVLLPAELAMAEMGDHQRVREGRVAFQAATADEFVAAVEQIVDRKVRAFTSGIDVANNVVFECFAFEPRPRDGDDSDPAGAPDRRVQQPALHLRVPLPPSR